MSLSPVKRLVLETMWILNKPAKAKEIAEEVGLGFPSVMMHIIGLMRMGYVRTPQKGSYMIAERGKKALGFPVIDRERAEKILAPLPREKFFSFYMDIGKPLNIYATSLQDFCDKILKVNVDSLEFHFNRGDFETWFNSLGDLELARKILLLKERKTSKEELQKIIYENVKDRCVELSKIRET